MLQRAYSTFEVKAVDDEERIVTGIASTPSPDRADDIVEPKGAVFKLPLAFLFQHREPIGEVIAAKVTSEGIEVKARVIKVDEPGKLKDRIDEAWQSIKYRLVKGFSIGFKPIEAADIEGTWGRRFLKWEWLELSAVTIPANGDASIQTIKAIAAADLAQLGTGQPAVTTTKSAAVVAITQRRSMKKTITEQIKDLEASIAAKQAEMHEVQSKASDEGRVKDPSEKEQFDTIKAEIKGYTEELADLREMEHLNKAAAVEVKGSNGSEGSASRDTSRVISLKDSTEPGIGLARALLCKTAAFLVQNSRSPLEIAKERYPSDTRIHAFLTKANQPAGSTLDSTWAGNLVDPTNLTSEFIEFLRPQTVIGKFGTGNIPSLRRVPFNVRITSMTTGGNAWWVGQGKPKPVTGFSTGATTLTWAKIAALSVITEELARFSSPSAEMMVRDGLRDAIVEQLDRDFVDPGTAAVANVSPASITNGITPLSSAGTSADNIRTDLQNLLEQFILANINPASLVLIMPNTLALAASLLRNSLGQPEFNGLTMNGGTLEGIPVITSQHAANQSGSGNLVVAVNASDIFLADDGQVTIDVSREASLQMLDNPTVDSVTPTPTTLVSLWQTNSIGFRAERFINWARRRTQAVAFIDDVNWGSIGSPS